MSRGQLKRAVCLLCAAASSLTLVAQTRVVSITFSNANPKYAAGDVHFMFGGGGNVQGTIDNASSGQVEAIVPNKDYTLAQIGTGGMQVSNFIGGKIFVSLGGSVVSTNQAYNPGFPDFSNGSADPASQVRWDKLETTIFASTNSTPSSGINMSAADFYSIPMMVVGTKQGVPSGTIGWHPLTSTATVFSNLAALTTPAYRSEAVIVASTSQAMTNGIQTVIGGTTNSILRVISPANVPDASPNPYPSMEPYVLFAQSNQTVTTVTGTYGGIPPEVRPPTPLPSQVFSNQTYRFVGVVTNGNLVLTGSGDLVGSQVITISSTEIAKGIYSSDPIYTLDSQPGTNLHNYNCIYDSVISDVIAGFNLGLVGSSVPDPRTGSGLGGPLANEETDAWYSRGPTYGLNPKLAPTQLFSACWTNGAKYFNEYSGYLSPLTDAYSFPYTDKTANPFMDLTYGGTDSITIVILPDGDTTSAPVVISSVAPVPNGGVSFTFDVPAGTHYSVDASENLSSWTSISSGTGGAGTESYSDNSVTPTGRRFYRISY